MNELCVNGFCCSLEARCLICVKKHFILDKRISIVWIPYYVCILINVIKTELKRIII